LGGKKGGPKEKSERKKEEGECSMVIPLARVAMGGKKKGEFPPLATRW